MDITQDIQALTTFRNHSAAFLAQLKKTQRPVVLTVNGKAAAVVQDAAAYQRLLEIAAQASAAEGIRQGREDVAKGRVSPARAALKSFRRARQPEPWPPRSADLETGEPAEASIGRP